LNIEDPTKVSPNIEKDKLVIAFKDEEKMILFKSEKGLKLDKKFSKIKRSIKKQKHGDRLTEINEAAAEGCTNAEKFFIVSGFLIFMIT